MTTFTARPTIYKGTEMRSRLEASFAAGLDRLQVPWDYEPMAYASPDGQYLPDFAIYLDEEDKRYSRTWAFIEVKPTPELAVKWLMTKMQIIRSTWPVALLAAATPEWGSELMFHWRDENTDCEGLGLARWVGRHPFLFPAGISIVNDIWAENLSAWAGVEPRTFDWGTSAA